MNLTPIATHRPDALTAERFTPGDWVVRYVNEERFVCLVVGVEGVDRLRVTCSAWPSGYNALVHAQDVVRLPRPTP